jgi:hypothetical protein
MLSDIVVVVRTSIYCRAIVVHNQQKCGRLGSSSSLVVISIGSYRSAINNILDPSL